MDAPTDRPTPLTDRVVRWAREHILAAVVLSVLGAVCVAVLTGAAAYIDGWHDARERAWASQIIRERIDPIAADVADNGDRLGSLEVRAAARDERLEAIEKDVERAAENLGRVLDILLRTGPVER